MSNTQVGGVIYSARQRPDRAPMNGLSKTALLIVDVQQGLDDPYYGARNNPEAERHIAELLAAWRAERRPVIHVKHMSVNPSSRLRPDLPGNEFKPEAMPVEGEPIFQKSVNSAFIGTGLESYLRSHGIEHVVMAGISTDHCVSSSARTAANLGFTVTVVGDATHSFERDGPDGVHYSADVMHGAALASLHGEFATVTTTREVLRSS